MYVFYIPKYINVLSPDWIFIFVNALTLSNNVIGIPSVRENTNNVQVAHVTNNNSNKYIPTHTHTHTHIHTHTHTHTYTHTHSTHPYTAYAASPRQRHWLTQSNSTDRWSWHQNAAGPWTCGRVERQSGLLVLPTPLAADTLWLSTEHSASASPEWHITQLSMSSLYWCTITYYCTIKSCYCTVTIILMYCRNHITVLL